MSNKNKKRKNPIDHEYITLLVYAYEFGNPYHLADAITYEKQGLRCNDCGNGYNDCYCEYCETCEFQRCLCNLKIIAKNAFNQKLLPKDRVKKIVRNEILRLVNNFNKSEKEYFHKRINEKK